MRLTINLSTLHFQKSIPNSGGRSFIFITRDMTAQKIVTLLSIRTLVDMVVLILMFCRARLLIVKSAARFLSTTGLIEAQPESYILFSPVLQCVLPRLLPISSAYASVPSSIYPARSNSGT